MAMRAGTVVAADRSSIRFEFSNDGDEPCSIDRFAFSSVCPVESAGAARVIERVSTHHVVAVEPALVVDPGGDARLGPLPLRWKPRHADDGPCALYLLDGEVPGAATIEVATAPPILEGDDEAFARNVEVREPAHHRVILDAPPDWAAALGAHVGLFAHAGGGDQFSEAITVRLDPSLAPGTASVTTAAEGPTVDAGELSGARAGLRFLLASSRVREPRRVLVSPRVAWRGVHLDLARQWFPASVVDRLIDTAARLGLNRVHLHLTDDEGWRFPVADHPALSEVGGFRGHGLAIPPLLGSGPDRSGGWYSATDIDRWVERAATHDVDLVPEIDLPGHCFAALRSVPELRDPGHTPSVESIQGFVGNVLYPGLPATRAVLDAALGSLVDLFGPTTIHLGGDEVPAGCWAGSPVVDRYAAEHALGSEAEVQRSFMAEVADHVRDLGCRVAVWEEAAPALEPGSGHVLAWTSHDAVARLVDEGHDVVACPAAHWYLDLAEHEGWSAPGTAWAGHLDEATAAAATFGSDGVVGAQACLWTEYVLTPEDVWARYHPRLDRLAERMWRVEPS